MPENARDIYVREVMTPTPVTSSPHVTAREAALLMRSEGVGSIILVEDGKAVGILTERDLVEKVVAEDMLPSKVEVGHIMSAPLITTSPDVSVAEAARRMSSLKVRRLPVVEGGELVGILTENDMLRISPSLIELTREWALVNSSGPSTASSEGLTGYCESCESFSDMLRLREGRLLCPDCRDMLG